MRPQFRWLVIFCLAAIAAPQVVCAQYGGALHSGGWANGMGVALPPMSVAAAPVPVILALSPPTFFSAAGTNAFAFVFLNAPFSEARARMRIVRVSNSVVVATSDWTSTSNNRVTISGLTVGTTYRAEVELEALTPAWLSVPWATLITSYVQPDKYSPPFNWELES
ncbi:MAG: hypothetical protein Q7U75_06945 [Desulfobacterales bacterium]|nr:hypothetical protein [Desulfobacterales bacterium]